MGWKAQKWPNPYNIRPGFNTPEPSSSSVNSPPQTIEKLSRSIKKLDNQLTKLSDDYEDWKKEIERTKRWFQQLQASTLINAEYTEELQSKLQSIQARGRPKETKRSKKQLSSTTALTPRDANRCVFGRDEQEKKRDHVRMLWTAARKSVSISQRLDENDENENIDDWEIGEDGKPLFTINTEGVTRKKAKICK